MYALPAVSLHGVEPGIYDSQRCRHIEASVRIGWIEPAVYAAEGILHVGGVGDKPVVSPEVAGRCELLAQPRYAYSASPVPEPVFVSN